MADSCRHRQVVAHLREMVMIMTMISLVVMVMMIHMMTNADDNPVVHWFYYLHPYFVPFKSCDVCVPKYWSLAGIAAPTIFQNHNFPHFHSACNLGPQPKCEFET